MSLPAHMGAERIRIQRVIVAPVGDASDVVMKAAERHFVATYETGEVEVAVESVAPIRELNDLFNHVITLADGHLLVGVPVDARPVKMCIELTYETSMDQQTPSRLESVVFPCRALADEADKAVSELAAETDNEWRLNSWPDGPVSIHSDDPRAAVGLAREMLEEEDGEEED